MKSDNALTDPKLDRFQRNNFAKRIAQTILNQHNKDSLTIGLYGKWGEGKTSVIEFVSQKLDQEAIVVRFNPWQFAGEQILMVAFFDSLADAIRVKLRGTGDKIAKAIRTYGGIATIGKFIPKEAVEAFANIFSRSSLTGQYKKISDALKQMEKPIVVFIDDIDRLESTEIQAVFKLVKLVADFPNVVYVLAFDPVRVVDALKGIFGDGQAYLEKIIQVPLTLPKAQPAALRRYTYDLIDQAVQESAIIITEGELSFFRQTFEKYLADYITTPRDPARISNVIRFSLPMLNREVNMGDLMILEIIKVLHPTLYQAIRQTPLTYTMAYNSYKHSANQERAETYRAKALVDIDDHLSYLPLSERQNMKDLLKKLFPQLKTLFDNIGYGDDEPFKQWHQQKRLCSLQYFNRYFTYAVIEGEIPETQFAELILLLDSEAVKDSIDFFKQEFSSVDSYNFILKLRFYEGKFTADQGRSMARLLCHFSDKFFAYDGYQTQYSTIDLISKYIALQPRINQAELSRELVESITSLSSAITFQFELWHINRRDDPDAPLNSEVMSIIEETLFHRLLTEIEPLELFTAFEPGNMRVLFQSWTKYSQSTLDLRERVNRLLDIEPNFGLNLLKFLSPSLYNSKASKIEKIYRSLKPHDFTILEAIADIDKLYQSVFDQYGPQLYSGDNDEDDWDYTEVTDMELIGQFQQWYSDRKNKIN